MLPNFLIVGAARSGTTSLYYYLKQHPDISFPILKEPKYFSSLDRSFPQKGPGDSNIDKFIVKDKNVYLDLFNSLVNKKVGEASPDYLYYHNSTAKSIYDELGDIPIIILLRNPILRAFSAYSYQRRDSREKLGFKEALDIEEKRLKMNYDFMWAYKNYGLYSNKVETFLNTFSNVKIILTDQLKLDSKKILKEVFEFLEVDNNFQVDADIIHNVSGIPKNRFVKFVLNRESQNGTYIRELFKKYIPRVILEKYSAQNLEKTNISNDDYNYLRDFFKNDVNKLNQIIKQDLMKWWDF